ncbi:MAG: hypothetical protein F7B60_04630 [Desulfurococcales archaeon]|nr:hypothetical protein [Desulfurococcales archaeon]
MIEAETAIIHGKIIYDAKLPIEWTDGSYKTIIIPGFSDGHIHPQVIDPGFSQPYLYSNSYEWIEQRVMAVDEAAVRKDEPLSARLAFLTYLRSVLEGSTLISVTGAFVPNVKAWNHTLDKPRTVFLPTTMRKCGWLPPQEIFNISEKLRNSINDSLARLGIFVHSLKYSSPRDIEYSYTMVETRKGVMGLHLSEGISELNNLKKIMKRDRFNRIIAVHCLNDKVKPQGLSCISCPGTNIILYNKLKRDIYDIDSFGSDWPHILGTVASHVHIVNRLFNIPIETLLFRLTTGGYIIHGISSQGDLIGFDKPLDKILTSGEQPVDVYVAGRKIVEDKQTVFTGYKLTDVNRETSNTINAALDLHGTGYVSKSELHLRLRKAKEAFLNFS